MSQKFAFKILMTASALILGFATNGHAVVPPEKSEKIKKVSQVKPSLEPETKKVKKSPQDKAPLWIERKSRNIKATKEKERKNFFLKRDAKKEEIKKLKSSSGLMRIDGENSECLIFKIPVKILAQIFQRVEFQDLMNLRLTCMGFNKLSLSDDFSSQYCLTIIHLHNHNSWSKPLVFRNLEPYNLRLYSRGISKKLGGFTCHPAAFRYVDNGFEVDLNKLEEINRLLISHKSLTTFILDIEPDKLNGKVGEVVEMLNLKPYIHTLVLPRYKGSELDTTAHQKMGKRFKHLKSLYFGKHLLTLNSGVAVTAPSHLPLK